MRRSRIRHPTVELHRHLDAREKGLVARDPQQDLASFDGFVRLNRELHDFAILRAAQR